MTLELPPWDTPEQSGRKLITQLLSSVVTGQCAGWQWCTGSWNIISPVPPTPAFVQSLYLVRVLVTICWTLPRLDVFCDAQMRKISQFLSGNWRRSQHPCSIRCRDSQLHEIWQYIKVVRLTAHNIQGCICQIAIAELQFRETSLDLRLYSFPDDPILPFTFIWHWFPPS